MDVKEFQEKVRVLPEEKRATPDDWIDDAQCAAACFIPCAAGCAISALFLLVAGTAVTKRPHGVISKDNLAPESAPVTFLYVQYTRNSLGVARCRCGSCRRLPRGAGCSRIAPGIALCR